MVVTLEEPDGQGPTNACATGLDPALVQAIADTPADYYLEVATADYPAGALRGQLTLYDATDTFGGERKQGAPASRAPLLAR